MIFAIGFERREVYICNVVKCRPPENRAPQPDEAAACSPFLFRQIEALGPKVICALGRARPKAFWGIHARCSSFAARSISGEGFL